jgi:hypothetical protein
MNICPLIVAVNHLPANIQSSRIAILDEEIGEGELQFRLLGSYYPKGLVF